MTGATALRRLARAAFALGVLGVTILSLTPQEALPEVDVWDKLQHALAYAALALAGALGFPDRRARLLTGAALVALGCALEAGQAFVPGRFPGAADALANGVGVVLGLATAWAGETLLARSAVRAR